MLEVIINEENEVKYALLPSLSFSNFKNHALTLPSN